MVRTQVQLTEEQVRALKQLASERKESLAGLVRQSIDRYLRQEAETGKAARIRRGLDAIGKFCSGSTDVSSEHNRYLSDAFLE